MFFWNSLASAYITLVCEQEDSQRPGTWDLGPGTWVGHSGPFLHVVAHPDQCRTPVYKILKKY